MGISSLGMYSRHTQAKASKGHHKAVNRMLSAHASTYTVVGQMQYRVRKIGFLLKIT